jgi:hypothetical protein
VALRTGEHLERLYRLAETLYCVTDRRRLIALDAKRGLLGWWYDVGREEEPIFRPCHAAAEATLKVTDKDGKRVDRTFKPVLVNTFSMLYVLDREEGTELRRHELPFAANTGGCSDGEYFYAGAANGLYHAVGLAWGVNVYKGYTGTVITAPVEYLNEHIYVASEDHTVYATRTAGADSEKVWTQPLGGSVVAPMTVTARGCFVPCEDEKLYAFHAMAGDRLWEPFVCRGPLYTSPQVARGVVFQYAEDDKLYAIDAATGAEMWSMPDGRTILAVMDDDVYVLDRERNLRVVDRARGEMKSAASLASLDLFLPSTSGSSIYAATRDGKVFCIRRMSAGRLTLEMLERKN